MRLFVTVLVLSSLTLTRADCPSYSFGSCSDPSIDFGFNLSSSERWGYQPNNGNSFPHGWSPDIATIESFICSRLQSPCNAPPDTVAACLGAFNQLSGLSGNKAVAWWNAALGTNQTNDSDWCSATPAPMPGFATTTTTTVYSIEPGTSISTTLTFTTSITTTSTYTDFVSTTYSNPSPSSTLIITLTLPASTPTTSESVLSTSTTSTQVDFTVTTTSVTATVAGAESTGPSPSNSGNNNQGNDGGGSPFDSGAVKTSSAVTLVFLGVIGVVLTLQPIL